MTQWIVTIQRTQVADVRVEADTEEEAMDKATGWDAILDTDFTNDDSSYEALSAEKTSGYATNSPD